MAAQLEGLFEVRPLLYRREFAFVQTEAYSFHFWCERITFVKNITFNEKKREKKD